MSNSDEKDIKFEDVEKQSYQDIKKVAKSIGVENKGTKHVILNRIKEKLKLLNTKRKIPQQPQQQQQQQPNIENTNSNNESTNEVILKEMDNNEVLFWKVIKNIYIKKIIFEKLKTSNSGNKIKVKKYEEINNCEWMIENGYFNLLRLKIKLGEKPMKFSFNNNILERNHIRYKFDSEIYTNITISSNHIFNIFKESTNENIEFYKSLFKNYPEYFQKSLQETVYIATEYDNCLIVQILVEDFGYVPSDRMVIRCISIGSFKSANYLNSNFNLEINSNRFWFEMLPTSYFTQEYIGEPDVINSRVKYLYSVEKDSSNIPSIPNKIDDFNHIFNCFIYNLKLKTVFECIETIYTLINLLEPFINSISNYSYKPTRGDLSYSNVIDYFYKEFKGIPILSIEEFNEIKLNFHKEEESLEIHQFKSSDKNNLSIQKLYEMLILFTQPNNLQSNFTFYKFKYQNGKGITQPTITSNIDGFNFLQFGIYNRDLIDWSIISISSINLIHDISLFKYCKNDIEKQIEFVDNIIQDSNDSTKNNIEISLTISLFFSDLLTTNGVDLIDRLFKSLPQDLVPGLPAIWLSSVKTGEQFDYFLKRTGNIQLNFNNIFSMLTNENVNLLEYLKSSHPEYYKKSIIPQCRTISNFRLFSDQVNKFFFENRYTDSFITSMRYFSEIYFQLAVSTLKEKKSAHYNNNVLRSMDIDNKLKVFNWFLDNLSKDEIKSIFQQDANNRFYSINDRLLFNFMQIVNDSTTGEIDHHVQEEIKKLLNENVKKDLEPLNSIFEYIGTIGSIELLELMMNLYFPNIQSSINDKGLVFNLIVKTIENGHLKIIKFLNDKYSFIFESSRVASGKGNPLKKFTFSQMDSLLLTAFKSGDIHISQYLISELKLNYKISDVRFSNNNSWLINYFNINKFKN